MNDPLPLSPFPEERRLATVLFADVQGFTGLAEQLDFETVSDLIKEIWSRLDSVIEGGSGYIDKHMGDAVMAIWGAPSASEHDAQGAIETALGLQEALERYVSGSPVSGVRDLKLRIGINTGLVFATYIGTRNEYTVIGDTVNIANRLEQAAEGGGILVGESTWGLLQDEFEGMRAPDIQAKGKTEPLIAYKITGRRESSSTRIKYDSTVRFETRMVAREKEMARLQHYFDQSENAVVPLLVLVTGDVGIGKSRLLFEFSKELVASGSRSRIVSVRGLSQLSRVPYYLWRLAMLGLLGIQERESSQPAQRKFEYWIKRAWGPNASSESAEASFRIGSLIGLIDQKGGFWPNPGESSEDAQEKAVELTRRFFCRLAVKEHIVLILDDLQWADPESLQLLSYLVRPGAEPLPILIIAGARLSLLRDQPQWWNASHILTLGPLPISSDLVIKAYPDLQAFPRQLLLELAARAEGNPYFLEEIVKGLLKSGIVGDQSSQDTINKLQQQIPESLRATLQARLDSLSREARTCALMAAVVGRVFWVGALEAIAKVNPGTGTLAVMPETVMDRLIQDGLRQLVRAELVFPRSGTIFSAEQEYIFKNSYLREVAYDLIPRRSRALYHRAVAAWLSEHLDSSFKVMSAEHFEQAGDYPFAVEQYKKTIEMAEKRGATTEARAISLRANLALEESRKHNNGPNSDS